MKPKNKNQTMKTLIQELKRHAIEKEAPLFKRIAKDLEKSTRARRLVNVYKIDRYAKDNEVLVVPGKVLGMGELSKKVSVAAYAFSDDARKKIAAKGKVLSLNELMKNNPKGQKVRILG